MSDFIQIGVEGVGWQSSSLLVWASRCVNAWVLGSEFLFLGVLIWYAWRREQSGEGLWQRLWHMTWVLVPALVLLGMNFFGRMPQKPDVSQAEVSFLASTDQDQSELNANFFWSVQERR